MEDMEDLLSESAIPAYIYGEQTVCPTCVKDIVVPFYRIADSDRPAETILGEAAAIAGVDRSRENSFSSYEFPKKVFESDLIWGHDYCYVCLRDF